MIEVTFYNNGYEINGHARHDICSEISIFIWGLSNVITNMSVGANYYTSVQDESDAGYGHLTFDTTNETAFEIFVLMKKMLPIWMNHYRWKDDGHVNIVETDKVLIIPQNFKVLKGIVTTELHSA